MCGSKHVPKSIGGHMDGLKVHKEEG